MMKWNSAKTYTENDMLLMHQEAVNRVRDFQTRARSASNFFEPPQQFNPVTEPSDSVPDSCTQENETAELSEQSNNAFSSASMIEAQSRVIDNASSTSVHPSDPIHGLLDRLGVDSETLLILGLMFLLYNEKADNVLLLALAYLLI